MEVGCEAVEWWRGHGEGEVWAVVVEEIWMSGREERSRGRSSSSCMWKSEGSRCHWLVTRVSVRWRDHWRRRAGGLRWRVFFFVIVRGGGEGVVVKIRSVRRALPKVE